MSKFLIPQLSYRQFIVLSVFVLACFVGNSSAAAQFDSSNFWSIDHTHFGSLYPDTVGYYYADSNTYQLTDTFAIQKAAIWNKQRIDLAKGFVLNFTLYFGEGKHENNPDSIAGDGICFVLHTMNPATVYPLIGGTGYFMGYGIVGSYIYGQQSGVTNYTQTSMIPSFAVEFDSKFADMNGYPIPPSFMLMEGGTPPECHIAYLKNANMVAFPNTFNQMQNNWHKIATGDWYCVSTVLEKNSTIGGYDFLTYVQEKHDSTYNGQLLLRNSMHFSSLSEIIDGLQVDASGHAYVTWGITSATSSEHNGPSNKHIVKFYSLQNGTDPLRIILCPADNPRHPEKYTITFAANPLSPSCGGAPYKQYNLPDTLEYWRVICDGQSAVVEIPDLDIHIKDWEILDSMGNWVRNITTDGNLESIGRQSDTTLARVVLFGDTMYLRILFKVYTLSKEFASNPLYSDKINIDSSGAGYMLLTDTSQQIIPLPATNDGWMFWNKNKDTSMHRK
ncbi:MAG: hypothetical protein LBO69_07050 [Ignavibacteria bacterium]|jgi:hypothetical protein|nr:hypothetical protein [Ignavibacteria bacterium]